MKKENWVLLLILIMIVLVFFLFKNSELFQILTGRVSVNYGYINLSIPTYININLSASSISWGPGNINSGENNATIYTYQNNSGIVERGNWSGLNVTALVLENIGNVNCSISIYSGKNAHDFFNSLTSSNEQYRLKVSNKENISCSGSLLNSWVDVNKTNPGTKFCNNLGFNKNYNEVYIDVLLTIPGDARNIGEQSDFIVITGDVSS